jgi:hypothetical protein
VSEVLEAGEVEPDEVYEVALAGNATMTSCLLGIDPSRSAWRRSSWPRRATR